MCDFSKIQSVGIAYSELLEKIYHTNTSNSRLFIEANSLRSTKELFRFCLDLFCKGLVMCHGDENRKVEIDKLSLLQIQQVIDKLSYTGIMTVVRVLTKEGKNTNNLEIDLEEETLNTSLLDKQSVDAYTILRKSVELIYTSPENNKLQDYNFNILVGDCVYSISFEIHV